MLLGDDIIIDNTKLCKKYFEYCKYNLLFLEEKIKIIISKKCELMVLRSSYKDKIKDLRSNAQETQAAIKIQDKLNELKSKDVIISSYRWIWELIQNAKDCPNSSGKINIDIKFDATQKIVEFKHNGKLFSTKNIVYLIEQVSTKERSRNSVSIGKFGTGFLTTNLLSSMVTISGLLHDDEDSEIAKFEVTIDRSGESIDELKKSIKNSCDQLEANTFNIAHNINENEMNTVFTYRLDDNGVKVAEIGLENFEITAPYVFAFVTELNKITINSNSEISEYTRTNGGITKNINAFVSRIHKSGFDKTINIFTIKDDTIMLATEINQLPDGNHIARYNEKLPKLFCDFPLLGTNDFSFPVVINSRRFDPTEPRNGIFLYGGNSEHNKKILGDACSLYTLMIDYFIQNDYKDIYNVVHLPPIENKDWVDKEWYNDEIISLLKNKICKFSMFQMLDDSIKAMQDDWGCKDNVFLLSDDNTKIREEVWKLSSQLFPSKHLYYEEIDKWYFSLWTECKNYGIIDLIKKVEQIGSISKLQDKIKNAIDWLNSLYKLIYEKCLENPEVSNRDNKIFPNQHGDFCCINSLKKDIGIDEAYKEVASIIGIDLKSELANVRIIFKNPDIMSFNDVAYRLMNQAQDYSIDLEVFYKHIIGMINGENSKQSNFISLYNNLYPNNSIITIGVNHCSERLLDNAIIYMCDKICLDLRKNKVLTDFLLNFSFKKECNAESWISNFITYLVSMEKTELLDKYSIIPNQNGVLCRKIDLYREADSIPDFMKDVCRVAGTDFRDELSSTAIEASKIIQHRKGYKEISEVITSYMHRHMNNINVNHDDKEAFNQTYRWLRDKKRENLPNTHREAISIFKN